MRKPTQFLHLARVNAREVQKLEHRRHMAGRVSEADQLADGIVDVSDGLAVSVGRNHHAAKRVGGDSIGLSEPVVGGW
jgi:hypothetical protein